MLYVQFKDGSIEKHLVSKEAWLELGRMIEWLYYSAEEIIYIDRTFYVEQ